MFDTVVEKVNEKYIRPITKENYFFAIKFEYKQLEKLQNSLIFSILHFYISSTYCSFSNTVSVFKKKLPKIIYVKYKN